jgi:hypothetical protein
MRTDDQNRGITNGKRKNRHKNNGSKRECGPTAQEQARGNLLGGIPEKPGDDFCGN